MAAEKRTKRLFGVRIHPKTSPHVMVALLATSAREAKKIATKKAGIAAAPVTVRECPEGDVVLVTFPSRPRPAPAAKVARTRTRKRAE